MFTILLHSSKTMRTSSGHDSSYQPPQLLPEAKQLAAYTKQLPVGELAKIMKLSAIIHPRPGTSGRPGNLRPECLLWIVSSATSTAVFRRLILVKKIDITLTNTYTSSQGFMAFCVP